MEMNRKEKAFRIHEMQMPITVGRSLYLEISRLLLKKFAEDSDENKALTNLGLVFGQLAQNRKYRAPLSSFPNAFRVAFVSKSDVLLYLRIALLEEFGNILLMSSNEAVKSLGNECVRFSQEVPESLIFENQPKSTFRENVEVEI